MKRVFSSASEVIHVYAQQTQNEGRSSNVFFEGKKIYSYGSHYLLGEFLPDGSIMINDIGYSVTTAKHISELRQATRHYKQYFVTETDLRHIITEVRGNIKKLANARKRELYISPILRLWEKFNTFAQEQKVKRYKSDPRYREFKKIVKTIESPELQEELIAWNKKMAKQAIKLRLKKEAEQFEKFHKHEIDWVRSSGKDHLRISESKKYVETSQNVKIPTEDAKLLYLSILRGVDVVGYRISHYRVDSINGSLKVGCHDIDIKEVHRVGELLLK